MSKQSLAGHTRVGETPGASSKPRRETKQSFQADRWSLLGDGDDVQRLESQAGVLSEGDDCRQLGRQHGRLVSGRRRRKKTAALLAEQTIVFCSFSAILRVPPRPPCSPTPRLSIAQGDSDTSRSSTPTGPPRLHLFPSHLTRKLGFACASIVVRLPIPMTGGDRSVSLLRKTPRPLLKQWEQESARREARHERV